MNKFIVPSFVVLFHLCFCLNFQNIDICSAYINYTSPHGHYGEIGVPSPENYFSARNRATGVYSATRNKFYLFGGHGYGNNGISPFKLVIFKVS